MRKLCFWSLLLLFNVLNAQSLKVAVISDIHYLSSELVEKGSAYQKYVEQTGRDISELHTVLDIVITELVAQRPDVVLIPGDLTNHGEKTSHEHLIGELYALIDNDIKVYVLPGNHDVNIPDSKAYLSKGMVSTQNITLRDFENLYSLFGYSSAVSRDTESLSYLVEVNDSIWILAIDTNKYEEHESSSITSGRIKDKTMQWALEILQEARKKDILVLGMMHHGLVEHFPFQSLIFSDYLVDDWYNKANELADAGLQLVFTGHFHSNDITELKTEQGNKIYDIETGSLAQYPFPFRLLEIDKKEVNIRTFFIDALPDDMEFGKRHKEIFEKKVCKLVTSRLEKVSFLIAPEFKRALTELLVRLSVMHVEGDEYVDMEMLPMIERLVHILGVEEMPVSDELTFGFPPKDNKLTIILR